MATPETIRTQLRRMLAALPQHAAKLSDAQIVDMLDVWQEDLADLDDALLVAACRNYRERNQWLPAISEIRASAVSLMRQASPANQIAGEAWGDVKQAIASVGYYGLPEFANPATAAVVRRMGWRTICLDSGPEGVIRAQFERMYDAEIERLQGKVQQSGAVRQFIEAMKADSVPALPPGDVTALIAQTADNVRR